MAEVPEVPGAAATHAMGSLRDYIAPVLSLVVGILILLPSAIGPLSKPYLWGWMLPAFFVLAALSVIALLLAFVTSGWTKGGVVVTNVAHGLGNYMGVGSLLLVAIFLAANYSSEVHAHPRIINVRVSPPQPEAGKVVEVELEVLNRSGRPLSFEWQFNGQVVAGLRTAYVKMPSVPGTYLLTALLHESDKLETTVEAGASAAASNQSRTAQAISMARTWLDVTEVGGLGSRSTAQGSQAGGNITLICNRRDYGNQTGASTPRTRASSPAGKSVEKRC